MTSALPAGSTIAVLGAAGTGRAELAQALARRLGDRCVTVAADVPLDDAAFTLLMGLDPLAADPEAQRADTLLRAALAAARRPFAVVHGRDSERLANALRALGLGAPASPRRLAAWDCDKCSDPACEHRLFTDLLRQRVDAGS